MGTEEDAKSDKIARGALSEAAVEKLRNRMAELRVTQEMLAKVAGMHQTGVSDVLKRSRRPAFDQMAAIARRLGLSLDWIADDDADETGPVRPRDKTWEEIQHVLESQQRLADHLGQDRDPVVRVADLVEWAASHGGPRPLATTSESDDEPAKPTKLTRPTKKSKGRETKR